MIHARHGVSAPALGVHRVEGKRAECHRAFPRFAQVEQDLVISRALVEIFRHPALADSLALRGGTALSKLQLRPPARYSEDIDLVQTTAQPAGPMMNALREVLEPWLGKPKWKQGEGRITFYFRYTAEGASPVPMRLKVEANTREHFALYGLRKTPFKVASRWFEGACDIQGGIGVGRRRFCRAW